MRWSERRVLLGLFLVTGTTLALEVLLTRLLSVITWYSLAFLVIAMGLLGLTAGAIAVYMRPKDSPLRMCFPAQRKTAHVLRLPLLLPTCCC